MHLDNNGTTFLLPEIRGVLRKLVDSDIGNPAALSQEGRHAHDIVESARESVAQLVGCTPDGVIFTSSGSEANASVIRSTLRVTGRNKIVLSQIEHSSLGSLAELLQAEGVTVTEVRVTPSGVVDEDDLEQAVDADTAVVSVQMVNNETGIIQPYETAALMAHRHGALFHTDAAQAVGKLRFSLSDTGADYLTFTAHKFHGPQGIGSIVTSLPWDRFIPLIPGGSQEHGKRGGTHNVLSIAGIGEAARIRDEQFEKAIAHMAFLRDTFESALRERIPGLAVNGDPGRRVCNTSNMLFPHIDGKALYLRLLSDGLACSQSSACTAQIPEPSKVLRAMGLSYDEAFSSMRFSFSVMNTYDEAVGAVETIVRHYSTLRALAA